MGGTAAGGALLFSTGVYVGRADERNKHKVLPSARTCCDAPPLQHMMTEQDREQLASRLRQVVGPSNVQESVTCRGSRLGQGVAFAVVSPGSLKEAIRCLELAVEAKCAVLPQGANTGLTGGSVPRDESCDRPTVVINMRRLDRVLPLADGKQVLCLAGAGIHTLGESLKRREPEPRQSHSVLGSIFLNPSVAAVRTSYLHLYHMRCVTSTRQWRRCVRATCAYIICAYDLSVAAMCVCVLAAACVCAVWMGILCVQQLTNAVHAYVLYTYTICVYHVLYLGCQLWIGGHTAAQGARVHRALPVVPGGR